MDREVLLKTYPILAYFEYEHLPEHLQEISAAFHAIAWTMADSLAFGPEVSAGLRKLLEGKDCCVRAGLVPTPPPPIRVD